MAEPLTKERVLEALKRVKGPDLGGDIVSLGLVSEIVINKGKVYFAISVDPARAGELEALRQAAEKAVADVPGVAAVAVTLTADRAPGGQRRQRQRRRAPARLSFHPARCCARCTASPRRRAGRGPHHRRGLGQGRRRQVDDRGQSRARAEGERAPRRHPRRRHLRPVDAAAARGSRVSRSRLLATSSSRWTPTGSRSCPWASSSMRRRR